MAARKPAGKRKPPAKKPLVKKRAPKKVASKQAPKRNLKAGEGDEAVIAAEVEAKEVKWIWGDRIPQGMMTIVAGRPDQGKGMFVAHVAADISRRGGNVIYSAAEDDNGMMTRPRLEAAGADLDRILLWEFRDARWISTSSPPAWWRPRPGSWSWTRSTRTCRRASPDTATASARSRARSRSSPNAPASAS